MILILTKELSPITDKVIANLVHLGVSSNSIQRINDTGSGKLNFKLENNSFLLECDGQIIDLNTIQIIWYKSGTLINFKYDYISYSSLFHSIKHENNLLTDYFNFRISQLKIIGNPHVEKNLNRLIVNFYATKLKLNVPPDFVNNLEKYKIPEGENLIVKAAANIPLVNIGKKTLKGEYKILKGGKSFANLLSSYFQTYIEKKYEIRSFYFNNKHYSMAIFSQNNLQTKIDYRNYDHSEPNRLLPFILPKIIIKKLNRLAKLFDLNTCSFDLIVDQNEKFWFLELNPCGEFDWLSINCNYFLELEVAKVLMNKHNE